MKTLILGMGNPILSDDGIGLFIAKKLSQIYKDADVAFSAMIGLNLFDMIEGYDAMFVIDAMTTRGGKLGEIRKVSRDDKCGTLHLFTSHGINIFELIELGKRCGYKMPLLVSVYGIEIGDDVAFGEELSPTLSAMVDTIAEEIISDIKSAMAQFPVCDQIMDYAS